MPRSIAALAAVAALVTAVPSAAQVGSGRIAYAREGEGVYTMAPDGSSLVLLKPGSLHQPRWSPDGTRIAFVGYGGLYELHVMNANGTDDHVVATDARFIALSRQPWSGDGSRVAWGPPPGTCCSGSEGEIYTASADGGDVRRLTTDGRRKAAPVWSPASAQLVYAAEVPGSAAWELLSVRDDGSAPVQITSGGFQNEQPTWSPSGASIAFVRTVDSRPAIYTVHPDGTELHRLVGFVGYGAGDPVWSPDGSKIAYTNSINGRYVRASGPGREIFLVDADGSGERRLTELAPQVIFDSAPTWSPDGDQILFQRSSLMTMNLDGTCEGALSADPRGAPSYLESPSWQPVPGGSSIGPKTCRAIAVEATGTVYRAGSAMTIVGTVSNEGTEPLTNVQVTIAPTQDDLSLQAAVGHPCARREFHFVCRIDRLGRGESQGVAVFGTARRVGRYASSQSIQLRARLTVTADGPLLPTKREIGYASFTPRRCLTTDPGRGTVIGTRFADRICGRRGADYIDPMDRKDYVYAGAGPDVINSGDIYGDVISCGPGRDLVFADRKDKVARDCERVRRS